MVEYESNDLTDLKLDLLEKSKVILLIFFAYIINFNISFNNQETVLEVGSLCGGLRKSDLF